jgi:hypothetical protein
MAFAVVGANLLFMFMLILRARGARRAAHMVQAPPPSGQPRRTPRMRGAHRVNGHSPCASLAHISIRENVHGGGLRLKPADVPCTGANAKQMLVTFAVLNMATS